jgi:hypothetical protein
MHSQSVSPLESHLNKVEFSYYITSAFSPLSIKTERTARYYVFLELIYSKSTLHLLLLSVSTHILTDYVFAPDSNYTQFLRLPSNRSVT